jgi:hypothetical protein
VESAALFQLDISPTYLHWRLCVRPHPLSTSFASMMLVVILAKMTEQHKHMMCVNLKSKYYTLDTGCKNQTMRMSCLLFVGRRLETTGQDIFRLYFSILYVSKLFTVSLTGAAREVCILLNACCACRINLLCIYIFVSLPTILQ